jgi:DNA processing protein
MTVLAGVAGLGPLTLARLRVAAGSASRVLELAAGPSAVDALIDASRAADRRAISVGVARAIVAAGRDAEATLRRISERGLSVVTLDDPNYPEALRAVELPPHVLFVDGAPAALRTPRAIAVVGTRRPTDLGRGLATRIATALARVGASVVSGLAIGIDGAAHDAAVREGGVTVAVLGSGHDRLVPAAHRGLAERIVEAGGAVISEFPPGTIATRGTFPRRNRIVSGLAEATVVVEAGIRSGALITASWALQQGRGCFLVPGSLDAPASAGCLAFLREAAGEARIVVGVPELLEDLDLGRDRPEAALPRLGATLVEVGEVERRIALELVAGRATVDELVGATDLETATVLGALTMLELRGLVASAYGRYRPAGRLLTSEQRA